MKNLFSYFQKNQSNLWFQTNRTRLRANYFNTQKNNRIYSNLFLALIYMQVGKNHTSLFHRGSFSVLLFRSRFTAGFFSFFASFGFFVFVPSVAVPFFTVVTTSTVTEKRKRKKYLKQISWHFRPHLITKYQKPSPCIHICKMAPAPVLTDIVFGSQDQTAFFLEWYIYPPILYFLLGNWNDFSHL